MRTPRPFDDGRATAVSLIESLSGGTDLGARSGLARLRVLAAAGWATHVAVIDPDPGLDATVADLRTQGLLADDTVVHHFTERDVRIKAAWMKPPGAGQSHDPWIADWLDWLTGRLPGALLTAGSPGAWGPLALVSNPLVARVAIVEGPPADRAQPVLSGVGVVITDNEEAASALRALLGATVPIEVVDGLGIDDTDRLDRHPWLATAARLVESVLSPGTPALLIDALATGSRVIRLTGVITGSAVPSASWECRLPGLTDPAGSLANWTPPRGAGRLADQGPPPDARAASTRWVAVNLRSNALAHVTATTHKAHRLDFSDGSRSVPLRATAFAERLLASRSGNARLARATDGTVWIHPHPVQVQAEQLDGIMLARLGPGQPASDVTHAVNWSLRIPWESLRTTSAGATFEGVLTASGVVPARTAPPAVCVTDVGGLSREVGSLTIVGEPQVDGPSWQADVTGQLDAAVLAATTEVAGKTLRLHVGVGALDTPLGNLRTSGTRSPMHLRSPRGVVTLLPVSGNQLAVAPGLAALTWRGRLRTRWSRG